jgi:undecaprenyl-diphosphatase
MLPISSSAHLIIFPWLFHFSDPGLSFDVALHVGSLVAIIGFFWREWLSLIKNFFKLLHDRKVTTFEQKLLGYLLIASIPGAIFGILLDQYAENALRNPLLIAFTLAAFGVVLWFADHHDRGIRTIKDVKTKDAAYLGIAQAFAIIPGISRSGITMTTGLFAGLKREEAARFSFLMSAPIIAGAALVKLKDIESGMLMLPTFWVAIVVTVIFSLIAISFLLKFLQKHKFNIFVYYRFALAALIVAVYLVRR